jgi:hypothetical protein
MKAKHIFDIHLHIYDDDGLIIGLKEKRKLSVRTTTIPKAYDKAKTKYPFPYFVELKEVIN